VRRKILLIFAKMKGWGIPLTCWRRLRRWQREGVWERLWRRYLALRDAQGQRQWAQAFRDGTFVPARKGARRWA
jgi:transposase